MATSKGTYTEHDERIYVAYLRCWRYPSPEFQFEWRTPGEFDAALVRYIEVNKDRTDHIGRAGCRFARQCLRYGQEYLESFLNSLKNKLPA